MRVELAVFECRRDGTRFEAPWRTSEDRTLLLRSTGRGTLRSVGPSDPVYSALSERLTAALGPPKSEFAAGSRARRYLSVVSDPDTDGSPYVVDAPPPCPTCGVTDVTFVQSTEPPRFDDVAAPAITHLAWSALDRDDQDRLLRDAG